MKPTLIVIIALIGFSFHSYSQDSLQIYHNAFGYHIAQGKKFLTKREASKLFYSNPKAYDLYTDARSSFGFGTTFGFAGGFLVGWQIGNLLNGREINPIPTFVGCGLIGASFAFTSSGKKKLFKAVTIYNANQATKNKVGFQKIDLLITPWCASLSAKI